MSVYIPDDTNNTAILNVAYTGSATQNMTVMAWLMAPVIGTPANYRDIVTVDPNIYMQLWSDGSSIDYGTQNNDHVGPILLAGAWYHSAQVVVPTSTTSRQIYGYLNGQLVVNVLDGDTSTTFTNICIGNSIFSSYVFPFTGNIKDVRVWQRQLTATEVVDEMRSSIPIHRQALVLWAPLNDNAYIDKSGNNNTLTVGSAVTLQSGPIKSYPRKNNRVF